MKNRRGGHIATMAPRTGDHYSLTTSTRHLSFRRSSDIPYRFFSSHHSLRMFFFILLEKRNVGLFIHTYTFYILCTQKYIYFFFFYCLPPRNAVYFMRTLLEMTETRHDINSNNNDIKKLRQTVFFFSSALFGGCILLLLFFFYSCFPASVQNKSHLTSYPARVSVIYEYIHHDPSRRIYY